MVWWAWKQSEWYAQVVCVCVIFTWLISVCCWAPWLSFSSLCCSSCFLSTFSSAYFTSNSVISLFSFATSSALSPSSEWVFWREASAPVARDWSSWTSTSRSLRLSWTPFLAAFSAARNSFSSWYSFSLHASFSDRLCEKDNRGHMNTGCPEGIYGNERCPWTGLKVENIKGKHFSSIQLFLRLLRQSLRKRYQTSIFLNTNTNHFFSSKTIYLTGELQQGTHASWHKLWKRTVASQESD